MGLYSFVEKNTNKLIQIFLESKNHLVKPDGTVWKKSYLEQITLRENFFHGKSIGLFKGHEEWLQKTRLAKALKQIKIKNERLAKIKKYRACGCTLDCIATRIGMKRQRIHQLLNE